MKKTSTEEGKDAAEESKESSQEAEQSNVVIDLPAEEYPPFNWFDKKKQAQVLLKVVIKNKIKDKIKVRVSLKSESGNVKCPESHFVDWLFDSDNKCITHLEKVNPELPFGDMKIEVVSKSKAVAPVTQPPRKNLNIILQ